MRQKILTYVVAGIFILFPSVAIATTYDFVPMELTKVPMSYMSRAPNSTVPFYYTDGTRADYDESMTRIRNTVAQPHIFVNDDNQYGMVVIDIKEDKIPFINYTGIPKTLKYYGFSRGKATSDVVVINTQGGPMPVLLEDEMVEMMADAINLDNVLLINVHQSQTLKTDWVQNNRLTFEQAKRWGEKSTKILGDLVRYFKSEGKVVYVTGFSYGAFAVADLLATYGNIADGYLISAGRLDMTSEFWKIYSKGVKVDFMSDGLTIEQAGTASDFSIEDQNMAKIAAAFGYKRYTKLLSKVNLKNVVYASATNDRAVGRLTSNELIFLKSKGVKVILKNNGHDVLFTTMKEGIEHLYRLKR